MPPRNKYGVPGLQEKPPGSSRYVLVAYDPDRTPQRKEVLLSAGTPHAAAAEAKRIRALWQHGRFDPWGAGDGLTDAVDRYLAACAHQADNTRANKRSQLTILASRIGNRAASGVTPDDVRRAVEEPGLAESSRRARLLVARGFFRWCLQEGLTTDNPARVYAETRRGVWSSGRAEAARSRTRTYLTPDEVDRLFDHLSPRHAPDSNKAIRLALGAGLRIAEVVHLNLRDVRSDGTTGLITLAPWEYGDEAWHPKYHRRRRIRLTPLAAQVVFDALRDGAPYEPLLRGQSGDRLRARSLSHAFQTARDAAGFDGTVTFHSLRHTALTYLALLDVSPHVIREWAGHSSTAVQDRYVHASGDLFLGQPGALAGALRVLCPGVPKARVQDAVDRLFDLSLERPTGSGAVRTVLFDGALYDK